MNIKKEYTPSPWHLSKPTHIGKWAGFNTSQGRAFGIYAANDDLECIAKVAKDTMLSFSEQNHEANALLISCAPEMADLLLNHLETELYNISILRENSKDPEHDDVLIQSEIYVSKIKSVLVKAGIITD